MFNRNWKDLRPFVTKLYFKLLVNYDWYPIEASKVSYRMSRLSEDAAWTMDPFFWNSIFVNFKTFVLLLEWIYNDTSREYIAVIKLKNLQQWNREFTSFFLEFLGFINKLDWNKAARVAAF